MEIEVGKIHLGLAQCIPIIRTEVGKSGRYPNGFSPVIMGTDVCVHVHAADDSRKRCRGM